MKTREIAFNVVCYSVAFYALGCGAGDADDTREEPNHAQKIALNTGSLVATNDAMKLAQALLGAGNAITITAASYSGAGDASGTYSDGPLNLQKGAMFTTGSALGSLPPNDSPKTTKNNSLPGNGLCDAVVQSGSSFDATKLQITFNLNEGYDGISLLSVFGSEEYPEYVGSKFNDVYAIYLNGEQIVFDENQHPITINGPFFAGPNVVSSQAAGTEYDGSTNVLQTRAELRAGTTGNTLEIVICDVGDRLYDSGVFLAGFNGCVGSDCSGTIPCAQVDDDHDGVSACDDCDDTDPDRKPGAAELCDQIDNDCDSVVDNNGTCAPVVLDGCGSDDGLQEGAPWPSTNRCMGRAAETSLLGPATSATQWKVNFAGASSGASAVAADGTIYVPHLHLTALNADGTQKWKFWVNSTVSGPTIGADGTVYVGATNGKVYAVRPDGTQKWVYEGAPSAPIQAAPAVGADGTIYVIGGYRVVALTPDGQLLWAVQPGTDLKGPIALGADGTLYVTDHGSLFAIRPDGVGRWSYAAPGLYKSSAVVGADAVYFESGSSLSGAKLYAVALNGTLKWSTPIGGVNNFISLLKDGTVLYVDGRVNAVSKQGQPLWSSASLGLQLQTIVDGAGTIYVSSAHSAQLGKFLALNPDGSVKWESGFIDRPTSYASLGANRTLYFAAGNKFYALGH